MSLGDLIRARRVMGSVVLSARREFDSGGLICAGQAVGSVGLSARQELDSGDLKCARRRIMCSVVLGAGREFGSDASLVELRRIGDNCDDECNCVCWFALDDVESPSFAMYRLEVRASELVAILVVVVPVVELGFDATVDDVDTDVGVDARIGCLECIHSISPSQNVVHSWHKNSAVWKLK